MYVRIKDSSGWTQEQIRPIIASSYENKTVSRAAISALSTTATLVMAFTKGDVNCSWEEVALDALKAKPLVTGGLMASVKMMQINQRAFKMFMSVSVCICCAICSFI